MGCKLLCGKCGKSTMTWLDPDREDLLDNGIMECNDKECKAQFVGIKGWEQAWETKKFNDSVEKLIDLKKELKDCGIFEFSKRRYYRYLVGRFEKRIKEMKKARNDS